MGTPQFMSPEQVRDEEVGPGSDIFSFGILLYLMTTRSFPFAGKNIAAIIHKLIECEYPRPQLINPDIPELMDNLIVKCLQKDRNDRYNSVKEIQMVLEKILEDQNVTNPEGLIQDFIGGQ
ncbi:MAG: protein kinase [bacterium]